MKELIEFLEKNGLKEEANSLKNGGTELCIYKKYMQAVSMQLAHILSNNNNPITKLSISNTYLGTLRSEAIAYIIWFNKSITRLDLSSVGIDDHAVMALANSLKFNNSITYLSLYKNSIGYQYPIEAANALADALKSNYSITELCLASNYIRDEGAIALINTLKNNRITILDLRDNQIGDAGVKLIVEFLRIDGCFKLIAEVFKINGSIAKVYLDENKIGDTTLKTINNLQRSKTTVEEKAENLNAKSNYTAAIKTDEKALYEQNKINAEKKYKEQQQALTFNQLIIEIKNCQTQNAENLINELNGAILNKIDNNGDTALTLAASNGLEKICELLINKMSNQAINQITNNGDTALTLAASNSLEKICELLINKMSQQAINHVTNNGNTALTYATNNGLEKVCELLIAKITKHAINQVTNNGNTALILAAQNGLEKVCELLINKMSNEAINQIINGGNTALTLAAQNGLEKVCELLIAKMTDQAINQITNNGNTALTLAASKDLEKVCELLINKMTDQAINQITNNGNTALTLAVSKGLEKVCELLINKMSNEAINHIINGSNTALTLAAQNGLEKVCELLINKMTDQAINQITNNGNTALTLAVSKGLEKVCELLIAKMTDQAINYVTNKGNTALTLAVWQDLEKVCELLINKMTDQAINHITNKGNTALTLAVWQDLEKVCELLINKMTDQAINHITNKGNTALTLAAQNGLEKIYNLLILRMNEQNHEESIQDKLAIFQKIVAEAIVKLNTSTAISAKDRDVMQNSINEITRTVKTFTNKDDINTMIKSMEELVRSKITKARIAVVEEDLNEIIEQQVKLEEHIRTEKLAIFQQVVADMTTKLESNTTINVRDKDIMQNSIKGIVSKVQTIANKTDIEKITESIKELISGKITKARLGVVEEDIDQLIEQQSKPSHDIISLTRIDQLNTFKLVIAKVITNLKNDNTITVNNKVVMQNSINEIINGVSRLTNVSDIEKITASMKEFTTGRITKGKLIDLEGEVDTIIVLQTNKVTDDVATLAVTEIIYDNPLLNHPKLLQAAVDSKLSSNLIQEAINNNDEELILGGLISVGYDVTTIG